MRTSQAFIAALILIVAIFISCSKSGTSVTPVPPIVIPPINPTPPDQSDTLGLWQKVDGPKVGLFLFDIGFTSPSNGILLGSDSVIYESVDGGMTWSASLQETQGHRPAANLFLVDALHGFAQGIDFLEQTNDGGKTWFYKPITSSGALYQFFIGPTIGFYSTDFGVFKTADAGTSWTQIKIPTYSQSKIYIIGFASQTAGFVVTDAGEVFTSSDTGSSWKSVNSDLVNSVGATCTYCQLQFIDTSTGYYATRLGVYKTSNGGKNWSNVFPFVSGNVNEVKFLDAQTGYYMADSSIYKTVDAGQTWARSCRMGNERILSMFFVNADKGWACTSKGHVLILK